MATLDMRCETRGDKELLLKRLRKINRLSSQLADEICALSQDFFLDDFVIHYGKHKYDSCCMLDLCENVELIADMTEPETEI